MNRLNYFSKAFTWVELIDSKFVPTLAHDCRLIRTAVRCSQNMSDGYRSWPAGPEYWNGYKGKKEEDE